MEIPALWQTRQNLLFLKIAFEKYLLLNGVWPENLDNLTPDYIDEIPVDVFDGSHLRYNLLEKNIYSIGADFLDSDGHATNQGDLTDKNELVIQLRR